MKLQKKDEDHPFKLCNVNLMQAWDVVSHSVFYSNKNEKNVVYIVYRLFNSVIVYVMSSKNESSILKNTSEVFPSINEDLTNRI